MVRGRMGKEGARPGRTAVSGDSGSEPAGDLVELVVDLMGQRDSGGHRAADQQGKEQDIFDHVHVLLIQKFAQRLSGTAHFGCPRRPRLGTGVTRSVH